MNLRQTILPLSGVLALVACGQPANGQATDASVETAAAQDFGAVSGTYQSEERHRYITFSYSHFGYSRPHVRWRDWDATLEWNAEDPAASTVSVVIDANSADSGVDVFDGHLTGENFFDTDNFGEITFVSTGIERTGDNTGLITGDLTIKDVTKAVTLDAKFNHGAFEERNSRYKIGFSATAQVKRSDFGLGAYAPGVSDEVDIVIEAEFIMPTETDE